MSYKLVAIDMDGTLLNDKHQVSKKNKEVIIKLANEGINFVLASGRPYNSLYPYTKELEVYLPLVTANGSIIKCPLTEKVYKKTGIGIEMAKEILDYGLSKDYGISFYYEGKVITLSEELVEIHRDLEGLEAHLVKDVNLQKSPIKIIFSGEVEEISKSFKELFNRYQGSLYITSSEEYILEVMNLEVSKGKALEYMIERMGIEAKEIIAIGNNFNDVAMFEVAGLSIAMDNSPQGVKNAADLVTKSNEEDGVAYALEKIIVEGQREL
ncbi:Cof-type HAD-IIB family hydrolase [Halonatronum saccharophilum]|uniref:Cof-type HAD-IIB family hydrolase n=1 Tax=Halonatronum saccharophilum TaxID=150060 RepID=UPI00047FEC0B|nr:Cof-type HAD-IIB family hydrolase [Halonatronum saccharophilum]